MFDNCESFVNLHHSTVWRKLNGVSKFTKSDALAIQMALEMADRSELVTPVPERRYCEHVRRFFPRQCDGRSLRESAPPSQPNIRAHSE